MERSGKKLLFVCLPIIAIFCYWLYGCVIGALATGEARMLKIGFVSLPLVAAILLSALKLCKADAR